MQKQTFLLRIPNELKTQIQQQAKQIGVSQTALITQILWEHLKEK